MATVIAEERPDTPDASTLIEELETHLASFYPIESRHGLSVERLLREQVAFFVTRHDGVAAGCDGARWSAASMRRSSASSVRAVPGRPGEPVLREGALTRSLHKTLRAGEMRFTRRDDPRFQGM